MGACKRQASVPCGSLLLFVLAAVGSCVKLVSGINDVNNIRFVIAPLGTNGVSHSTSCGHYGMDPAEPGNGVLEWNETLLARVAANMSYTSIGKVGCCARSAWCDRDTRECFSTGFGSGGYENLGWKGPVASMANTRLGLKSVAPVYMCVPKPTPLVGNGSAPLPPLRVDVARVINSGARVEILGRNFGKDPSVIKIFTGDHRCTDIQICSSVCQTCSSDDDCGYDEECLKLSGSRGVCLKPCKFTASGLDKQCPCETECRRLFTDGRYKRFCMNKNVYTIADICSKPVDSRLTGQVDSKVSCAVHSLHRVCPSNAPFSLAPGLDSMLSNVSISIDGVWANADGSNVLTMTDCGVDADCDDNDPCTVDSCTVSSGGEKCCEHNASQFCQVGSILPPSQRELSSDFYVMVDSNRDDPSVPTKELFGSNAAPPDAGAALEANGFKRLSASDVDDSPLEEVEMSFDFPYLLGYQSFQKIYPSPNGAIQFQSTSPCGSSFSSYTCGLSNAYYNLLAPLVTDFNPKFTRHAQILAKTEATRTDVVFLNLPVYRAGGYVPKAPHYTFMASLYKDGTVQFFYLDVTLPVEHTPQMLGMRGLHLHGNDILLNGIGGADSIRTGAVVTFCPTANFACMDTVCGASGTRIRFSLFRPLSCGNGDLINTAALQCDFEGWKSTATYASDGGNNHWVECSVPSGTNNANATAAPNTTNATGTVATPFGNERLPNETYLSVSLETTDGVKINFHGARKSLNGSLSAHPLVFKVDNRAGSNSQCSGIPVPQCNSCQIDGPEGEGKDCSGTCFGGAIEDACGACTGGSTNVEVDQALDCAGVCHGTAEIDACGTCAGGSTGKVPVQSASKCVTYCAPGVALDDCGVCGGNNRLKDCDGVCYGSNFACRDGNDGKGSTKGSGNGNSDDVTEEEQRRDTYMIAGTVIILSGLLFYNCVRSWRRFAEVGQAQEVAQRNRPQRIEADVLAAMPTTTYCSDGPELQFGGTMCAICICDYENEDILRNLPCGHHFHQECIDRWFGMNRLCPVCKADASGEAPASEERAAVTIEMAPRTNRVSPRPPPPPPPRNFHPRTVPPPPPSRPTEAQTADNGRYFAGIRRASRHV